MSGPVNERNESLCSRRTANRCSLALCVPALGKCESPKRTSRTLRVIPAEFNCLFADLPEFQTSKDCLSGRNPKTFSRDLRKWKAAITWNAPTADATFGSSRSKPRQACLTALFRDSAVPRKAAEPSWLGRQNHEDDRSWNRLDCRCRRFAGLAFSILHIQTARRSGRFEPHCLVATEQRGFEVEERTTGKFG